MTASRTGLPAMVVLLAGLWLTGCATAHMIRPTRVLDCPAAASDVPVSVEVDPRYPWREEIANLLGVRVGCRNADYDPVTEQGRWRYWVELTIKPAAGPRTYTVHLTGLERRVVNNLDRGFRDDTPATNVQEFKLDMLRADLHLASGGGLSFPCAERIGAPGHTRLRARSGVFIVHRRYTGDVTVKEDGKPGVRFVPVRVAFDVGFVLPGPAAPGAAKTRDVGRSLEWVRLADRCETCRPVLICESLSQAIAAEPAPSDPFAPAEPPYRTSTTSPIHVMAGLERRPVDVEASLADRRRTVTCTRWRPVEGTRGRALLFQRDSTEQGLPPATPYLTVHHVARLSEGTWTVELLIARVLDQGDDVTPTQPPSDDAWKERTKKLIEACQQEQPVFTRSIEVSAPVR